ncbi:hypothetical protein [Streptomyces sp. cmx-18-6]|uniref:hypothetical protein n=1 Tax=Streptomyces sp. cmx-18-6 TaxID=2790930 RepID=UPI003980171F
MNHGPEKTPHTDPDTPDGPDRPHDESAQPDEGESPEPGPSPARADDDDDAAGAGHTSGPGHTSGSGHVSGPGHTSGPGHVSGPAGADSAAARADRAAGTGAGAAAGTGAAGDDLSGTLTDLFGGGRGGRGPGDGPGTGAGLGDGPDDGSGFELDEVALRRMLHGAVGDLEASDRALEQLQRAVPARRARRRQAVVGAAAAALLIGTAVPAFVHVAKSDDSSIASPAIAGHGEQAQGGNGDETDPEARNERPAKPTDRASTSDPDEPDPSRSPSSSIGKDPEKGVTGGVSASPPSELASLPVCDPGQLGVASAWTDAPGTDGTVYGSFRIANVSGAECTVSSSGTVGFTALGAADPLKIDVIQHTAGDAASGLPDPSQEPGTVLLKPTMAYEVRFAWVPTDTCPTVAPSPSPTPSSDGTGGTTSEGSGQQSGVDAQSLSQDGAADGSVAVTHTPEAGAPTAATTIPNACSGTIYRTGVLATD